MFNFICILNFDKKKDYIYSRVQCQMSGDNYKQMMVKSMSQTQKEKTWRASVKPGGGHHVFKASRDTSVIHLPAREVMKAEGLNPTPSGAYLFLLPAGWWSVGSAVCGQNSWTYLTTTVHTAEHLWNLHLRVIKQENVSLNILITTKKNIFLQNSGVDTFFFISPHYCIFKVFYFNSLQLSPFTQRFPAGD